MATLNVLSAAAALVLVVVNSQSSDGLMGPVGVDPQLDCGFRALAYNFSLALQPERAPQQAVFDALRLGAECNMTMTPPNVQPQAAPRATFSSNVAAGSTWYADPVNGDDSYPGTLLQPFKTVVRALVASRGGTPPAQILLRNGTFYLPLQNGSLVLTPQDSGLAILAYGGETPVLSAGVPLTNLTWSAFNTTRSMRGPYVGVTDVDSCVGGPGQSSAICSYNGTTPDAATCASQCSANATCTAYTWHDSNQAPYALDCYFRTDGVWTGEAQSGHTSGQKVALNVYVADLSGVQGLTGTIETLFLNSRRAIRARYPNGNPEIDQTPVGFTQAASWLPHHPYSTPTDVNIPTPNRDFDPWFPAYQWGINGSVSSFNPPGSFWGSTNPPAGSQYQVPGGLVWDSASFSQRASSWSNPSTGIVHAFHGGRWGDWAFQVNGSDPSTNTLNFGQGGWQEARGWGSGAEFYIENVFEEIDAPGEWFHDSSTNQLYFFWNGTGPPPADAELVAAQLTNVLTVQGEQVAPVIGVTFAGLTFAHTAPTFMLPYEVPSGGDWSFYRGGMVMLQGTMSMLIKGCTFWSPGGNGLMISNYNVLAAVTQNEFAYCGESAVVSVGTTNAMDGTDGNQPTQCEVSYNIMREVGLYTKQSGAYYHATSRKVRFIGNVAFNLPRAGININDGFAGGHTVQSNLIFNSVRETADHGCFNSWDREPYMWDPENVTNLLPALTTISGNFFVNNYASTWPIDHDDGSNSYLDTGNVLLWGGFKNYLGFAKHSIGNLYVYPEYSVSMRKGRVEGGNGGWSACAGSAGTSALPLYLTDVWSNNTCVTASGSAHLYSWDACNPSQPYDGHIPILNGNTIYSGDGSYGFTCGSAKYTTLAQAQAAGMEAGSALVPSVPTTQELLAMAQSYLAPQ